MCVVVCTSVFNNKSWIYTSMDLLSGETIDHDGIFVRRPFKTEIELLFMAISLLREALKGRYFLGTNIQCSNSGMYSGYSLFNCLDWKLLVLEISLTYDTNRIEVATMRAPTLIKVSRSMIVFSSLRGRILLDFNKFSRGLMTSLGESNSEALGCLGT